MLRSVGLDVCLHRDIVLQAWLHEEADVGRQVVLQTKTESGRELSWCTDCSLFASLVLTIHIEVCMESGTDGHFDSHATSLKIFDKSLKGLRKKP
jgi:hypothetical protein